MFVLLSFLRAFLPFLRERGNAGAGRCQSGGQSVGGRGDRRHLARDGGDWSSTGDLGEGDAGGPGEVAENMLGGDGGFSAIPHACWT